MIKKFIAYYRVSTTKQDYGIDAQKNAVARVLQGQTPPWELIGEFEEKESGKNNNRPKLNEALALAKKTGATLIIAKLDRLGRNAAFLMTLLESDVELVACDYPNMNKFMLRILAVFAQEEREAISARTKAGLAVAKARGAKLGNPNPAAAIVKGHAAQSANKMEHAKTIYGAIKQCQETGVKTLEGLAECLTRRGFKTARNGSWTATAVRRIMQTIEGRAA